MLMILNEFLQVMTVFSGYKDAMPLEKAYAIISSESGTHFDPVIAEAFLNSRGEIEEALRELAEE